MSSKCSTAGCTKWSFAGGQCKEHYKGPPASSAAPKIAVADNVVKSGGREEVVRPESGLGGIKSQYPSGSPAPAAVSGAKKEEIVRPVGGLPKPGANEPAKQVSKWSGITMAPKQSADLTAANAVKKEEPKKNAGYASPAKKDDKKEPAKAAAAATTGAVKREPNKVFVEKFDGKVQKEPVVIELGEGEEAVKTGVFIGQCKGPDVVVQVKGKCKNITVSNCENIAVVFDTCVTTCELIGCKRLQVQAMVACGSYVVDKCDRTDIYAADRSLEDQVVVYTCQSTASVVHQSTSNGEDQLEHAIPNQILSTFSANQAPTHKEVVPEHD
jgi:hypothetical protein